MATHSSILAESHGQRSLVGYSPRGFKSQTQRLYHHQIISKISQFMPLLSLHFVPTEIFFLERCFVKILLDLRKIATTVQSPFMSTPGFPLCYYLTSVWYLSQLMNQYPTELSNFFFFGKNFNFDFSLIKWNLFFVLKVTIENTKIPVASESSIWAKKIWGKKQKLTPQILAKWAGQKL